MVINMKDDALSNDAIMILELLRDIGVMHGIAIAGEMKKLYEVSGREWPGVDEIKYLLELLAAKGYIEYIETIDSWKLTENGRNMLEG